MGEPYTQDNLFLSVSTPLGQDVLLLERMHGEERLSGLFFFTLEMKSEVKNLAYDEIVGKNVTVTVEVAGGNKRHLSGVVTRFVQGGTGVRFTRYHAEVRPWLWLLTLTRDSRIFQNKTVPQIIEEVCTELGYTDYRNSLQDTYDAREYCVQYQESAFHFLSRLMEDEGIFYFFEHTDGKHTLVLADDLDAHVPCAGISTLYPLKDTGDKVLEDLLTDLTMEQQVISGEYAMEDFNFETPSNDLLVSVAGTDGNLRLYEYPGGYTRKDAGEKRAKRRIEACEWHKKKLKGNGHCPSLTTGYQFELEEHERDDINGSYVLSRVTHTVSQESYSNSFEAFPASVPFRPSLETDKPGIYGSQTAIVVGKSGEEIWTDKYGRIKVQFHWDQKGARDEKSSCWVRVAHGWAGKAWGGFLLPRIGQEVVVSFLEGDPDRPLITGSVYNAEQTVPYALPGEQTKSTLKSRSSKGGGVEDFNEIRLEDKKGSEEIYIHAQKDMSYMVENDWTSTIQKNRKAVIKEANETIIVEQGNRDIDVQKGNETHKVKGTRDLTVTGKETHTDEADFTHTVKGNYSLTINGNLTIDVKGSISIKSGTSMKSEAGTSLDNKAGTSLTNDAGTSLTNKAGLSMENKASASINQKAATQTIEGSGMLALKGGIVKVN